MNTENDTDCGDRSTQSLSHHFGADQHNTGLVVHLRDFAAHSIKGSRMPKQTKLI